MAIPGLPGGLINRRHLFPLKGHLCPTTKEYHLKIPGNDSPANTDKRNVGFSWIESGAGFRPSTVWGDCEVEEITVERSGVALGNPHTPILDQGSNRRGPMLHCHRRGSPIARLTILRAVRQIC